MPLVDAELNPDSLVGARQRRGPSRQMEQQRSPVEGLRIVCFANGGAYRKCWGGMDNWD